MRVEYHCGMNTYREWICLEHPPGFARAKAIAWWKRRTPFEPPDCIALAIECSDSLTKPVAIRVKPAEKFWEITGYDLTGFTIAQSAEEAGADTRTEEPIDFLGEPF